MLPLIFARLGDANHQPMNTFEVRSVARVRSLVTQCRKDNWPLAFFIELDDKSWKSITASDAIAIFRGLKRKRSLLP